MTKREASLILGVSANAPNNKIKVINIILISE